MLRDARRRHSVSRWPWPPFFRQPLEEEAGASPDLMDKLGQHLAFERTGTRLSEALISKLEAYGSF